MEPVAPPAWLAAADRSSPWAELAVAVLGLDETGFASADVLLELGARVVVLAEVDAPDRRQILEVLGAEVRTGDAAVADALPYGVGLVVTSPSTPSESPTVEAATVAGLPVWSDAELAWRLMPADRVLPWLGVAGRTTGRTADLTAAMLDAAGHRVAVVGGRRPIIEALNDPTPYDVLVVELSPAQLRWSSSLSLHSVAVVATGDELVADERDLAVGYERVTHACVFNEAEPATQLMVEDADVVEGARAIGVTTGIPAISMVGIVDDLIVDRAFIAQRRDSALPLANLASTQVFADPHDLLDLVVAATLARSYGAPAAAVARGMRSLPPGP